MRALTIALTVCALACGGTGRGQPARPAVPATAAEFTATRWIPARPTYALAARRVRDLQRSLIDAIDALGMPFEVDVRAVSAALREVIVVDPLSGESLTSMGIDLDGGIAVYSEALNPTLVVHLSAPDQTRAFFDEQRARGQTQSQIVDGVEVFAGKLAPDVSVSWAIDRDWLWVHFTFGKQDDGVAWFTASRQRTAAPAWAPDWEWARAAAKAPSIVGFVEVGSLLGTVMPRAGSAIACAQLVRPVGRAGFAVEGDTRGAALHVSLDLGPAAALVAPSILPQPENWEGAVMRASLAAQWNFDLPVARAWFGPCARALGIDLSLVDERLIKQLGVRAARVVVQKLDAGEMEGTGAVSLELASKRYFEDLLDDIPLRSTVESRKQFGPHVGRRLSVPLGPTVDYVLADTFALAAVGDGLLAGVVGKGGTTPSPVLAVELVPGGLSRDTWAFLLRRAGVPAAARVADRLAAWKRIQLAVRLDGTRLVIVARGERS